MYLDPLAKCPTRFGMGDEYERFEPARGRLGRALFVPFRALLRTRNLEVVTRHRFDPALRMEGRDWPSDAETMIGIKRLENVRACVTDVLERGVPGDLLEAGVWRGGTAIFMRAILKAHGDTTRTVWAADSFQGLPKPDAQRYPADANDQHWQFARLVITLDDVKENFRKYGLLDDQVRFLVGWFKDTLPGAPIERLAVLRLDGDMYESTMDTLNALYPRLSPGGYVIVDDYGALANCRAAVDDYRARHGIAEEIRTVDWSGIYWQRRGTP
jgi:O-methyltransferase